MFGDVNSNNCYLCSTLQTKVVLQLHLCSRKISVKSQRVKVFSIFRPQKGKKTDRQSSGSETSFRHYEWVASDVSGFVFGNNTNKHEKQKHLNVHNLPAGAICYWFAFSRWLDLAWCTALQLWTHLETRSLWMNITETWTLWHFKSKSLWSTVK